ncbi:MAG: alpha-1,2-fucosyltransferase [Bacteroidales bacterium]|nr:alpha-1,2-fucosyltransferase [Bacteroidales bacterium]
MIIAQISGGLGNQLFQYALGKQLALKHNTQLKLDINIYQNPPPGATKRQFELNNFNIEVDIASIEEIKKIKRFHLKGLLKSIYWRTQYLKPYHKRDIIKEKTNLFDSNVLKASNNIYIEGYWQSEKYFKNIKDKLLKEFKPKNIINTEEYKYLNQIISSNSCSVHIRRGDYISNPKHHSIYKIIPFEYYEKSIDCVNEKEKNVMFFIFSDDLDWAKKAFNKINNIIFVDINDACKSMYLMSCCKHNIISNSTFSWWGAWLNNNPDKIVVTPQEWFQIESKLKTDDLLPKDWVKKLF